MSDPFIAEVKIFAGNFAPRGWATCDGQLISIAQNTALFSLLGTTYGGNGTTNFGLPNLQARTPIHAGNGAGLSPRFLGESGGQASVALSSAQIPPHSHALRGTSTATTGTPGAAVALAGTGATGPKVYRAATNLVPMSASLASAGNGQPHENRQPFLGLLFIIAMVGIFPARN